VAVVLTLVQTKQIRINIQKRNSTKTQYKQYKTVNTSIHLNPPTHTHTHVTKQVNTSTIQVKTNTVQDKPKLSSHNTIKYPQYKVTLMYMAFYPQELHRNSLHFTSK